MSDPTKAPETTEEAPIEGLPKAPFTPTSMGESALKHMGIDMEDVVETAEPVHSIPNPIDLHPGDGQRFPDHPAFKGLEGTMPSDSDKETKWNRWNKKKAAAWETYSKEVDDTKNTLERQIRELNDKASEAQSLRDKLPEIDKWRNRYEEALREKEEAMDLVKTVDITRDPYYIKEIHQPIEEATLMLKTAIAELGTDAPIIENTLAQAISTATTLPELMGKITPVVNESGISPLGIQTLHQQIPAMWKLSRRRNEMLTENQRTAEEYEQRRIVERRRSADEFLEKDMPRIEKNFRSQYGPLYALEDLEWAKELVPYEADRLISDQEDSMQVNLRAAIEENNATKLAPLAMLGVKFLRSATIMNALAAGQRAANERAEHEQAARRAAEERASRLSGTSPDYSGSTPIDADSLSGMAAAALKHGNFDSI